jgi:uncharacterized protein
MELALQVVGLKMTGKIEDARDVAMRIVNTTGPENMGSAMTNGSGPGMQLAGSSRFSADLLHLLRARSGETGDFEKLILDFLAVLDTSLAVPTFSVASTISHTTASGQNLLHLATFLGFSRLVQFLLEHHIDMDARDKNGYTALHFAALRNSTTCARLLVQAGAALDIVNALGKTAAEIAQPGLFEDLFIEDPFADDEESENDLMGDKEDEAAWGDVEEVVSEDDAPLPVRASRRRRGERKHTQNRDRSAHKSMPTIVSSEDEDLSRSTASKKAKEAEVGVVDEKQMAASIMDMLHRTFAQLQHPQGMMQNIPLHLPGIPAWPVLQQMPTAFPVLVPIPTLLWGDRRSDATQSGASDRTTRSPQWLGIPTAQEWKGMWERWALSARPTDEAPPAYTPRDTKEVEKNKLDQVEAPSSLSATTSISRRVGYERVSLPEQEVKSYGYRPTKKQVRKQQKKHDRMLILFWIPILFSACFIPCIGSFADMLSVVGLIWALMHSMRVGFHAMKAVLSIKAGFRA